MQINYTELIFFGKPDCLSNRKQLNTLRQAGIPYRSIDILKYEWTPELLASYFGSKLIEECVNKSAPLVKSNAINLENIRYQELLALMCKNPLLIRRPLIKIGEYKYVGFDWKILEKHYCIDKFSEEARESMKTIEQCSKS